MDGRKSLYITDENGVHFLAELLTILCIDEIEYAVYSMDKDVNTSDVYVARVIKDNYGNDSMISIDNEDERKKVFQIIDRVINEVD